MIKANDVMMEYYEVLNRNKEMLEKIKDDKVYSEQWKLTEMKKVQEQVAKEQLKFKDKYLLSIKNELQEIKDKIFTDIPEVLKLNMDFNEDELKLLSEKYKDNYMAMRKITEMAKAKDVFIEVEYHDYMKDVDELKKAEAAIAHRFGTDPFADSIDARLRKAAGLK